MWNRERHSSQLKYALPSVPNARKAIMSANKLDLEKKEHDICHKISLDKYFHFNLFLFEWKLGKINFCYWKMLIPVHWISPWFLSLTLQAVFARPGRNFLTWWRTPKCSLADILGKERGIFKQIVTIWEVSKECLLTPNGRRGLLYNNTPDSRFFECYLKWRRFSSVAKNSWLLKRGYS